MYRLFDFYQLSRVLTGYHLVELEGTGVGEEYCATLSTWIRQDVLDDLYNCFGAIRQDKDGHINARQLRDEILASGTFGAIARNIIKMWYLSIWYHMDNDWNLAYGVPAYASPVVGVSVLAPQDYVISNNAYVQGLAWSGLGSHPMGAKQPGYGTWSEPV